MKFPSLYFLALFSVFSCIHIPNQYNSLAPGIWRGEFVLNDQNQIIITKGKDEVITRDVSPEKKKFTIPCNFMVYYNLEKQAQIVWINGKDSIVSKEVYVGRNGKTGEDTFLIEMHPYDACIKGIFDNDQMKGNFIVRDKKNYSIPFQAKFAQNYRFEKNPISTFQSVAGEWQVNFIEDDSTSFAAVGEFTQDRDRIQGTFRTETGDFGFLEGQANGNSFKLSCFDGAHVFLFDGVIDKDSIYGDFYSGNHFKCKFQGKRTNSGLLKNANEIAKIKSNQAFIFQFENQDGKMITNNAEEYKDKIKIVQLSGTWCPNCKDESNFLKTYLENNPNAPISVFAIFFERSADKTKALQRIKNYKDQMQIPYNTLYGGISNRDSASSKIPAIDQIHAFPTLLYLNQQNQIVKVHTGFDGPATSKYKEFAEDFHNTIERLSNSNKN
ncbi:MAG TPA: hypothetical protein PK006_07810 [Saprospiraceae bacterium]|nr:hypothetical protein [Saprospiraceae bacterium]